MFFKDNKICSYDNSVIFFLELIKHETSDGKMKTEPAVFDLMKIFNLILSTLNFVVGNHILYFSEYYPCFRSLHTRP